MASSYPTTLDSFATTRADATVNATTQAADHNNYADAVNKIEIELGTTPSGSYTTVRERLEGLTTQVAATTQSGTTYTLALVDAGSVVELTAATAVAVTVPPNSTVAFPIGTIIVLLQYGAGQVTITPGAGVTIRSPGGALKTTVQYSTVNLRKRGTNEWVAAGDLTT